jgi:hypothetical protein
VKKEKERDEKFFQNLGKNSVLETGEGMKLQNYAADVRTFACTYVRSGGGDVEDFCAKKCVTSHYNNYK